MTATVPRAGFFLLLMLPSLSTGDEQATNTESAATELPDGDRTSDRDRVVEALRQLSPLVGEWKGVAQPKRGSSAGSWSLKAAGAWDFSGNQPSLVLRFDPGNPYDAIRFTTAGPTSAIQAELLDETAATVVLVRQVADATKEKSEEPLVFETPDDREAGIRCTLRLISEIRIAVLFEERTTAAGTFRRVAEYGLTRSGARLASGNTGERQCIVTGGLGTIAVSHRGKTYYVCCEGCRQAFEADPEGTLDAYRKRLNEQQGASPAAKD